MSGEDFLSRWSRRKHAAKAAPEAAAAPAVAGVVPAEAGIPLPHSDSPANAPAAEAKADAPLPPVESLTPESDFTPFMRPGVDPGLRQQAMRTLVRDPRFNVMDGLDVYIADFSIADPIPADWLGKLNQMAHLGDCWPKDEEDPALAEAPQDGATHENSTEEQQVAIVDPLPQLGASTSGSPPPELKES